MTDTVGLTLGKFAPLHKGHEYMIRLACEEMDQVIIVIYDSPLTTTIPLTVRANWIRRLFPEAEVIEAWDGPADIGDTPEIRKMQEDYILTLLGGRAVTHFYSSEFYGEHMSAALGAVNRQVDANREQVPISATMVRESPYQYKPYVDDVVYKDLITKVVFLGAPSTGKSTMTERMSGAYQTMMMTEYGREYWENHQIERRLTLEQLVDIAEGHVRREDRLVLKANGYLFVDTNAITTYMFSKYYHNEVHPRLEHLAVEAQSRYDIVFVCADDIPYDNTWDRSGEMQRSMFQKQILSDLNERRIPYLMLHGSVEERMAKVIRVLKIHRKYTSIAENMYNE